MKTDFSFFIYDKYYSLTNRRMKLILKDGRHVQGFICGFFRGDPESDDPYIIKWHIVSEGEKNRFGTNIFGCITGEIIRQEDIAEIYFNENKKNNL